MGCTESQLIWTTGARVSRKNSTFLKNKPKMTHFRHKFKFSEFVPVVISGLWVSPDCEKHSKLILGWFQKFPKFQCKLHLRLIFIRFCIFSWGLRPSTPPQRGTIRRAEPLACRTGESTDPTDPMY